ncbi:MAG: hypothetical protein ACRD3J_08240 [Thermoanaerobaculia bacterium]
MDASEWHPAFETRAEGEAEQAHHLANAKRQSREAEDASEASRGLLGFDAEAADGGGTLRDLSNNSAHLAAVRRVFFDASVTLHEKTEALRTSPMTTRMTEGKAPVGSSLAIVVYVETKTVSLMIAVDTPSSMHVSSAAFPTQIDDILGAVTAH